MKNKKILLLLVFSLLIFKEAFPVQEEDDTKHKVLALMRSECLIGINEFATIGVTGAAKSLDKHCLLIYIFQACKAKSLGWVGTIVNSSKIKIFLFIFLISNLHGRGLSMS